MGRLLPALLLLVLTAPATALAGEAAEPEEAQPEEAGMG